MLDLQVNISRPSSIPALSASAALKVPFASQRIGIQGGILGATNISRKKVGKKKPGWVVGCCLYLWGGWTKASTRLFCQARKKNDI